MTSDTDWAGHQLAAFFGAVAGVCDERAAVGLAVEWAAEVLEAEVGVLVRTGAVVSSVGFPTGRAPDAELLALAATVGGRVAPTSWASCASIAVATLDQPGDARLLLVREGDEAFTTAELSLLRAAARGLHQTLLTLGLLEEERELRAASEALARERESLVAELTERQALLERLSRIQRSISHRMPLEETLDAITAGAAELLQDGVVGLRLIDPDDPDCYYMASQYGIPQHVYARVHRGPIGSGVGGAAIAENRLVIVEDYQHADNILPAFAEDELSAAMGAPVHEHGRVVGSLVVASYLPGRRYTPSEQHVLAALAEHASLAISDAKSHAALLEAQHAKDMFLAMVSHELKTPLTVIMGAISILSQYDVSLTPDLRAELLTAAGDRGRQLEALIDSLLRGARAELAGEQSWVDVRELMRTAVAGFTQIRRVTCLEAPSCRVLIDVAAVRDVVGILLENALTHSPDDSTVRVSCETVDGELRVCVANDGELPDDTDFASLFVPFQRGVGARSSGVGLGLYIAARVADSLSGRIEVSSESEVAFTLHCPVEVSDAALVDA